MLLLLRLQSFRPLRLQNLQFEEQTDAPVSDIKSKAVSPQQQVTCAERLKGGLCLGFREETSDNSLLLYSAERCSFGRFAASEASIKVWLSPPP